MEKEFTVTMNSKNAADRAEAVFKKKEDQTREGATAWREYEEQSRALHERTAKLKSLRLSAQSLPANIEECPFCGVSCQRLCNRHGRPRMAVTTVQIFKIGESEVPQACRRDLYAVLIIRLRNSHRFLIPIRLFQTLL